MKFKILTFILFSQVCHAGDCIKEFNDNTSISGAGSIGDIRSPTDLKRAKWALEYLSRCESEADQGWVSTIKKNRSKIEASIANHEESSNSLVTAKTKCSNFDSCADKVATLPNKNWYTNEISFLKKMDDRSLRADSNSRIGYNAKKADEFARECDCFVRELGVSEQAAFAAELVEKWNQEDLAEQKKQAKLKAEQDALDKIESAKREKSQQIAAAKLASPACKAAIAKKEFCGALTIARVNERMIEHENEVGRESGYVNKAILRNSTSTKIKMEKAAEASRKKYQSASGSDIKKSDCGITDEGSTSAAPSANLDQEEEKACGYLD